MSRQGGSDWQFFIRFHDINDTLYKSLHTLDLDQFDQSVGVETTIKPSVALLSFSQLIPREVIEPNTSFCILVDFYGLEVEEVRATFDIFTNDILPLCPNATLLTFGPPHLVKTTVNKIINIRVAVEDIGIRLNDIYDNKLYV